MTKVMHVMTVPMALRFLQGQSKYMRERGLSLVAVTSRGPQLEEFGRRERVDVFDVEMTRAITPLRDALATRRLMQTMARVQPTIVHTHTPKGGLLGLVAAVVMRTPIRIYQVHGLPYIAKAGMERRLLRVTERVSCRLAHRVFCVSHSIRNVAISDKICPPEKIVVLGSGSVNGVDAAQNFNPERFSLDARISRRTRFGIGPNDLVVGFVGRIVKDKGIQELFEAWTRLRSEFPSLRLVLVGPVERQDPISVSTLNALRSDPRVVMIGTVNDTAEHFALLDLVVLPTFREGFGVVLLEAAAMELPVVATRIPGCVDAVEDGVTGTLVPARDAGALADAIRMYLDDPELRQRHGKAGRERVLREFRQEVIWEAVYQEYCRLLREKGLPVPEPIGVPAP